MFPDLLSNVSGFLVLVFGLVEFVKRFGIKGEKLILISMSIGTVLGVLYKVAQMYPVFGEWFQVVMFGVAVGLAASGVYDFLDGKLNPSE